MIAPLIKSVHVGHPRNSADFTSTLKRTWREALCGGWCCNMMIDVGPPSPFLPPLPSSSLHGNLRYARDDRYACRLRASYWSFMKVYQFIVRSTPATIVRSWNIYSQIVNKYLRRTETFVRRINNERDTSLYLFGEIFRMFGNFTHAIILIKNIFG